MPMREDIWFDSHGAGRIHACIWQADGKPKAVVQVLHGIAEHVLRYEPFALFLNEHGIAVVAEDHMGHGQSGGEGCAQGHFAGGWFAAIEDSLELMKLTKERFGDVPYILFGHSMGSFMARTILARYPDCGLSGCVICGTGWQPEALLSVAIPLCRQICKRQGEKTPSSFLQKLMFGSYNKRVEHPRTASDWLSRDNTVVDAYEADPKCGFIPAAGLVRDMLTGIRYIQRKDSLSAMDKKLPCLFVAGGDDPVGAYGKGVLQTAEAFQKAGMEQVTTKIYPLCRHEILNEINRQEVYADLLAWIEKMI